MEYHRAHMILMGLLIFKEIIIYVISVRRSINKIKKERLNAINKNIAVSIIGNKLDAFIKQKWIILEYISG